MIRINHKEDCCGCNACGDICPTKAISFKADIEGFWYPSVDEEKCIDCKLCENVCPVIHSESLKHNEFKEPECHAAIHKNYEVRFDSTSGGLFSAFAEKIYRDGGYVGGAIYDENWDVHQFISNNKADLIKLRSSKYTQSNAEGFYLKVKEVLKTGKEVLICGTPCQIAALRSFLKKDYDNLFLIDFICRGVNSPKIYHKFENCLEQEMGSKIVWQKAKNKELGWRMLTQKYIFANKQTKYLPASINPLGRGYLQTNAFSRPSCYECRFKGLPRISDITIADFWGIDKISKEMDDDIGTSLVMINNSKGKKLYDAIHQKIRQVDVSLEQAIKENPMILVSQPKPKVNREEFFKDINIKSFKEVTEKYFPADTKRHGIISKIKYFLKPYALIAFYTRFNPIQIIRLFYYNVLSRKIISNFRKSYLFYPNKNTIVQIDSSARIKLNAQLEIGHPRLRHSNLESRFLMEENSYMEVNSDFLNGYGTDIEIFKGASLIIKSDFGNLKGGGANMGLTLICGNHIEIGEDCRIGRHVTIRDNNGNHYLNMQGYKASKPVIIGKHVWLCESCTIMQGVKIGDGAVVSAHSVVLTNVPPYSLVAGNPAKVIQHDINWKL